MPSGAPECWEKAPQRSVPALAASRIGVTSTNAERRCTQACAYRGRQASQGVKNLPPKRSRHERWSKKLPDARSQGHVRNTTNNTTCQLKIAPPPYLEALLEVLHMVPGIVNLGHRLPFRRHERRLFSNFETGLDSLVESIQECFILHFGGLSSSSVVCVASKFVLCMRQCTIGSFILKTNTISAIKGINRGYGFKFNSHPRTGFGC